MNGPAKAIGVPIVIRISHLVNFHPFGGGGGGLFVHLLNILQIENHCILSKLLYFSDFVRACTYTQYEIELPVHSKFTSFRKAITYHAQMNILTCTL